MNTVTSDVLIVLGGGRTNDGSLTRLSLQRLDKGIDFYHQKISPRLVALGGHFSTYSSLALRFDESGAKLRGDYFIRGGVLPNDIIYVEDGKDTIGEAFASKKALSQLGLKNVGLITSDKHLRRSLFIFSRILGDTFHIEGIGVPCGSLLIAQEEAAYFEVVKSFFTQFPADIPDPDLENWYREHKQLYAQYKTIHDQYHPPGKESQAYMGVKR